MFSKIYIIPLFFVYTLLIQKCWSATDCDYVKLIFENFNKGFDANWKDNEMSCCKNLLVECNKEGTNVVKLLFKTTTAEGTIHESIGSLSKLREIDMGNNKIYGSIPDTIGQLSNLRVLNLGSNKLNGTIPESIYSLTKLEKLYV